MTNNSDVVNLLSDREYQVFLFIVKGLKTSQISKFLNLKSNTISTYKHKIYFKLKVDTDIDLYKIAIKNDIVKF
jgi:DNA-binding NarL/FixJ family response regulator